MYKKYNTYFIVSLLWFGAHFIFGLLDESRKLIDNEMFIFGLLVSTLNLAFACYLGTKAPDNYYQDEVKEYNLIEDDDLKMYYEGDKLVKVEYKNKK